MAYAHGQMREHQLENIMMDFMENNITIAIKEWMDNPKRIEFLKRN